MTDLHIIWLQVLHAVEVDDDEGATRNVSKAITCSNRKGKQCGGTMMSS